MTVPPAGRSWPTFGLSGLRDLLVRRPFTVGGLVGPHANLVGVQLTLVVPLVGDAGGRTRLVVRRDERLDVLTGRLTLADRLQEDLRHVVRHIGVDTRGLV